MAQDPMQTNGSSLGSNSNQFHPQIMGMGSNDMVSALQMPDGQMVFFNKASGHAITKSSTNGLCFLKGKFYFAAAPQDGLQFANIFVSQPFGANELSLDNAVAFEKQRGDDFMVGLGPNVRHIDLQHILHKEIEMYPLAQGTPLHSAVLQVENERLVLLFESFTGIKGKAILDDQLNPISTVITEEKDSKKD
jgi:hypothetical protein